MHWSVTERPTASWVIQQLRETFPLDDAGGRSRYLVHDRDAIFSPAVVAAVASMGLESTRTSTRAHGRTEWPSDSWGRLGATYSTTPSFWTTGIFGGCSASTSPTTTGIGRISESRRTRRWLVPWNSTRQVPP